MSFALSKIGVEDSVDAPVVPFTQQEARRLGEQAANIWLTNYQLAAAMGDAYEFVPLFFLQPLLGVSEKNFTPLRKYFYQQFHNIPKKASESESQGKCT